MEKDNRHHPLLQNQARGCLWCGYDANPLISDVCEVCGRSLDQKKISNGTWFGTLKSPSRWIGLSALVLLAGGSYGLWKHQAPVATSAPEVKRASDIRPYPSIKDVPNVPKGLFSYHSALPFAAITAQGMNDLIQKAFPEFQLRYSEPSQGSPGSTAAIKMLIEGETSFASAARPLEDAEIARAKERGVTLEQVPVFIYAVVFYTNPDVSLPGLSLNQAQDIYSGKITNWRELGGPNLPIVPFSLDPKAIASPKQALGDVADQLGQNVRIMRDHTEAIRQVGSTPGAISFGGTASVVGQKTVRVVSLAKGNSTEYVSALNQNGEVNKQVFRDGTYPLTRRAFVVIRRNSSLDEQAGVAYANFLLTQEGQQIVERSGFVPLNSP